MCVNVHWPYRFFNDFHNEHQEQLLCYSHLIRFPEFYKWVCSLSVVASCLRGNQETQGRNSKHFLFSSDLNTISFFLDHRAGKLTNQYLFPFCIPYQGFFAGTYRNFMLLYYVHAFMRIWLILVNREIDCFSVDIIWQLMIC